MVSKIRRKSVEAAEHKCLGTSLVCILCVEVAISCEVSGTEEGFYTAIGDIAKPAAYFNNLSFHIPSILSAVPARLRLRRERVSPRHICIGTQTSPKAL